MLDAGHAADLRGAFERAIDTLGVPAVWRQTAPPGTEIAMQVGARLVGRGDVEVVNAIGIGGRILTAKSDAFGGLRPEKFDSFDLGGAVYVANSVHEVLLGDALIGWKIMARAQS